MSPAPRALLFHTHAIACLPLEGPFSAPQPEKKPPKQSTSLPPEAPDVNLGLSMWEQQGREAGGHTCPLGSDRLPVCHMLTQYHRCCKETGRVTVHTRDVLSTQVSWKPELLPPPSPDLGGWGVVCQVTFLASDPEQVLPAPCSLAA